MVFESRCIIICVRQGVKNCFIFELSCRSTPRVPSFKIPLQMSHAKVFTGYSQGDPIMTEENEYFTIPQVIMYCLGASDSS